jgi:hypothetical protein
MSKYHSQQRAYSASGLHGLFEQDCVIEDLTSGSWVDTKHNQAFPCGETTNLGRDKNSSKEVDMVLGLNAMLHDGLDQSDGTTEIPPVSAHSSM